MLHFFRGLGLAFRSYGKSFQIIRECKLGWVFFIPVLILIINLVAGGNLSSHFTNIITDWIRDIAPFSMGDSWWANVLRTIASFLVWISLFFILVYIGGFVLLILLSPVLVYVSEKVDQHITGKSYPFVFGEFISDIFRGVRIALRNLTIEIVNSVISLILGFIPLVGFVVPVYLLSVAAYFYGFSFMDYTLERRRFNIQQSVATVRQHKGTAVGLGLIYMVFTTIPLIGFALAGFVAILSTVAATLATHEIVSTRE